MQVECLLETFTNALRRLLSRFHEQRFIAEVVRKKSSDLGYKRFMRRQMDGAQESVRMWDCHTNSEGAEIICLRWGFLNNVSDIKS